MAETEIARDVRAARVGPAESSRSIWDDDLVLAIMDINPVTDGHRLVIPKVHSVGIDDIPAKTAAFQEVFHSHLHVFRRFPDDGFTISADWGDEDRWSRTGVAADRIRTVL